MFSEHLAAEKIAVKSTWSLPSRVRRSLNLHGRDATVMANGPFLKRATESLREIRNDDGYDPTYAVIVTS